MDELINRHCLIVGAPGSGKSTFELKRLVEEADRGETAIICQDPHQNSLSGPLFVALCERGHRSRILYDRLSDVDRVLKWDLLSPSTATCPRQRRGENQTACDQFAEVLLRRRGKDSAADAPSTEEWLLAALNLYIRQRHRRPLADIRYAFNFGHPTFESMLEGCEDADVRCKFEEIRDSRQTPYKPAERLIAGVCRSPAFQVRTEHAEGFDFARHLDKKGIIIVEGGEGGALSADAMRTMMGAILLKTLNYIRDRKRERPGVRVALDEANNANLIGQAGHEVRALAELRKYGLGMDIMVQLLDFPSSRIERAVLATCATRYYFSCSDPRTANLLGEDLGGCFQTPGTKTRYYKDGSTFDAPYDMNNPYAAELRNLGQGEYLVRRGTKTSRERCTPLPNSFGFSKETQIGVMEGLLQVVKQRPEYFSPDESIDRPPTEQSPSPNLDPESDDSPFGI
jgi:hypothetical protein